EDPLYPILYVSFLAHEGNLMENYPDNLKYPMGYNHKGTLVTCRKVIIEMAQVIPDNPQLKIHVEQYFELIDYFPPWETKLFEKTVTAGRTPRTLEGPHKYGRLKVGERRLVVYSDTGELIFGPYIK
ncbi:hypothetical protein DRO61_09085, partial [Candidatus Bathyarchaeota archaeon]